MSDDSNSSLLIGRVETGYVIVVTGRGTCRESVALDRFATAAARAEKCTIMVDLSACDYLDSTFLGCLVNLQKRFGLGSSSPFAVVASPEKVAKLLAPSKLDRFLTVIDKSPEIRDTLMVLSHTDVDQFEMGRHVMDCHRLLAGLGGRHAAAFAAVSDQLERELDPRRIQAPDRGVSG